MRTKCSFCTTFLGFLGFVVGGDELQQVTANRACAHQRALPGSGDAVRLWALVTRRRRRRQGVFIGFTLLALVVDQSGSPAMRKEFYAAKAEGHVFGRKNRMCRADRLSGPRRGSLCSTC